MVKARVVRRMRSPGALANPQTVLAMFGTPLVATGALVLAIPAAPRALNAIPLPLAVTCGSRARRPVRQTVRAHSVGENLTLGTRTGTPVLTPSCQTETDFAVLHNKPADVLG